MNNQKTFADLVFNQHPNNPDGVQATLSLGNDINISVVSMKNKGTRYGGLYGVASLGTYEVAVFRHDSMLPLSPFDDVLGWLSEDEITKLMAELQTDHSEAIAELYLARDESRKELELD